MKADKTKSPKCYSYLRFSTPEQRKGDSYRRQIQLSEDYAEKNGFEIDDSLRFEDTGVSAFKGIHRTKGALKNFLDLIEKDKIFYDSILLVESLDRLSREQVLDALNLFASIIQAGVKVVSLSDGMEYDKASINANFGQLLMSIVIMSRAHEESSIKSKRLIETWKEKRKHINQKKLTARAPAWLNLSKDRKEFIKIPERCQIIEEIFEMKLQGQGAELIARKLNQRQGIWSCKNGWRKSYIVKILKNKTTIGEFQSHRIEDGKRQPVGEPIKDYFPRVISDNIFYQVQDLIAQNTYFGGRTGKVSNLFTGLIKCGYCGSSMQYINKGRGNYLVCDKAKRKIGCHYYSANYLEIESLLLRHCKELDANSILPDKEKKESELTVLKSRLRAMSGKSAQATKQINNLTDSIATNNDKDVRKTLELKLSEVLKDLQQLEVEKKKTQGRINKVKTSKRDIRAQIKSVRELSDLMNKITGQERAELRLKLRDRIRRLIEWIDIYSVGYPLWTEDLIKETITAVLEVDKDLKNTDKIITLQNKLKEKIDNKDECVLRINFRTGSLVLLRPYKTPEIIFDLDRKDQITTHYFTGNDGEVNTWLFKH